MSLFERIQNKRYDLQESGPNDPKFFTGKTEDKFQGSKEGKKLRNIKKKSTPSITRGSGVGPTERINPDDIKTQQTQDKIAKQRVKSAQKSGNIGDFSNKPIEGAPDTKKLIRGKKGETIANPIKPTKKTISKTSGTTQIKGVKDTELKPKTTGDEGQFRRNARRRKITGDVMPKKDLPKPTKTVGVNQADVSKKAKEFTKQIEKKRVKKLAPIDLKKTTKRVDLRKIDKKISRKRPSNAPSLADIKKKIDIKNPVEVGTTGPKPVKGTVLKVDQGKFKRVKKTSPEGQKILKKQVGSDELLGNKKKIVNNTKSTPKSNLFSKLKSKVKGFLKPTPLKKYPEFTQIRPNSATRPVFGKGIVGQSRKYLSKVPGRYKGAALAIAGTVAAGAYAKKKLFPAPKPEPKQYYTRPVKLTLKKDLGYRSKGAENPIKTKISNDRATSLPPKTSPSGFYKSAKNKS